MNEASGGSFAPTKVVVEVRRLLGSANVYVSISEDAFCKAGSIILKVKEENPSVICLVAPPAKGSGGIEDGPDGDESCFEAGPSIKFVPVEIPVSSAEFVTRLQLRPAVGLTDLLVPNKASSLWCLKTKSVQTPSCFTTCSPDDLESSGPSSGHVWCSSCGARLADAGTPRPRRILPLPALDWASKEEYQDWFCGCSNQCVSRTGGEPSEPPGGLTNRNLAASAAASLRPGPLDILYRPSFIRVDASCALEGLLSFSAAGRLIRCASCGSELGIYDSDKMGATDSKTGTAGSGAAPGNGASGDRGGLASAQDATELPTAGTRTTLQFWNHSVLVGEDPRKNRPQATTEPGERAALDTFRSLLVECRREDFGMPVEVLFCCETGDVQGHQAMLVNVLQGNLELMLARSNSAGFRPSTSPGVAPTCVMTQRSSAMKVLYRELRSSTQDSSDQGHGSSVIGGVSSAGDAPTLIRLSPALYSAGLAHLRSNSEELVPEHYRSEKGFTVSYVI